MFLCLFPRQKIVSFLKRFSFLGTSPPRIDDFQRITLRVHIGYLVHSSGAAFPKLSDYGVGVECALVIRSLSLFWHYQEF